jgi:hypothetical protein
VSTHNLLDGVVAEFRQSVGAQAARS